MLIDDVAPDFEAPACMPDNTFKRIKLSDCRGSNYVVLFFYPADFTFVCASEVPGFHKLLGEFEKRNVKIFGCSTDTEHAHKAWKVLPKELGGIGEVGYPLIADATKEIAMSYDVLLKNGLCTRGVFLIDKEGVVRAEHRNGGPLGRNLQEIIRLVDALQFHEKSVAEGNAMVCPVNWSSGAKAMEPTLEGVAKFGV